MFARQLDPAMLFRESLGRAMMLFYTTQKQGYHVDELYTYELTNYPGSFYALSGGFVLYGYIYNADDLNADDLLTLAESALPVAHAEPLTDTARCPVYYIKLK